MWTETSHNSAFKWQTSSYMNHRVQNAKFQAWSVTKSWIQKLQEKKFLGNVWDPDKAKHTCFLIIVDRNFM